ncbi:MAG TPA: hypothetical protein VNT79_12520 [Phycisphaerae bacterium]|nr:hypothetical protein [Phycisphaerae bacterium]
MSLVVSCSCGKKFKAKEEMAGKKVRCPDCKTVIRIPGGEGTRIGAAASAGKGAVRAAMKSSGASAPAVDAEAALLKYEAAQKKKQVDAETEAAYRAEQQKIIASYDQLAGKATTTELEKKKNKEELIETGVKKKPTVATKAADAGASVLSNSFVKYVIIVGVLGGLTYGSVMLVKFITGSVDEQMTSVMSNSKREETVKNLFKEAREAINAGDINKANKALDEVVRVDPSKERHRTYTTLRDQVADLAAGKNSKP